MTIFLVEAIVLCVLFTILILCSMKKPLEVQIYSYPPAIINRVAEMGMIERPEKPRMVESVKRKWPVIIIFGVVIALIVYFVNGANTFLKGFSVSYGLWLVVDWYDAIVMDMGWFCHSKKVRIPGTEDMTEAYQNYWFHIKASLIGMVLGLPACFISGVICLLLP